MKTHPGRGIPRPGCLLFAPDQSQGLLSVLNLHRLRRAAVLPVQGPGQLLLGDDPEAAGVERHDHIAPVSYTHLTLPTKA